MAAPPLQPAEKVLVVGGGPVGTLIALVARQAGADVLVAELDAFRRDFARSLGLEAIDPAATDVTAFVDTWTDGAGVPVAFEVSGAAAGVGTAVECLGVRGRLCLVAIHPRPREVNLHRFFWRELHLVGARLYDRSDFERAVELVAAGTVRADKFITTDRALVAHCRGVRGAGVRQRSDEDPHRLLPGWLTT